MAIAPVAARVDPAASAVGATGHVEARRTPVTQADLKGAISRAYGKINGKAPAPALLDTLTAHASLETGSGGQMYNFNFGGIKGKGPTGQTAVCRTKEVQGGKEIEIRDGFRAYGSLDEGAADYVRLMQGRFGGAVSKAESGDVGGFAHALKKAGYYTADETKYANALEVLSGHASAVKPSAAAASAAPVPATTNTQGSDGTSWGYPPSTVELSRVLDAIARHPTTVDDDDDDA